MTRHRVCSYSSGAFFDLREEAIFLHTDNQMATGNWRQGVGSDMQQRARAAAIKSTCILCSTEEDLS